MINMFKGNLVLKQENNLFLENSLDIKKIYVCNPEDYELKKEYKFFIYTYATTLDKGSIVKVNFGFNNIKDVIDYEELMLINSIKVKAALSIITKGYDEFVELININDIKTINKKYDLDKKDLLVLINYFNFKLINSLSEAESNKLREVFFKFKSQGFKDELVARSVWKYRDAILNDELPKVYISILEDIQAEQSKEED